MTLDEMLALLPDNTTGQIGADDLRSIVTDLYHSANSTSQAWAYQWSTNAQPHNDKHASMDLPWQLAAATIYVSNLADDGTTPMWTTIDAAAGARLWITNAAGSKLIADVTGPTVPIAAYREVPVTVASISGPQPANNAAVTVTGVAVYG